MLKISTLHRQLFPLFGANKIFTATYGTKRPPLPPDPLDTPNSDGKYEIPGALLTPQYMDDGIDSKGAMRDHLTEEEFENILSSPEMMKLLSNQKTYEKLIQGGSNPKKFEDMKNDEDMKQLFSAIMDVKAKTKKPSIKPNFLDD